jgi:putative two-component system response regulator
MVPVRRPRHVDGSANAWLGAARQLSPDRGAAVWSIQSTEKESPLRVLVAEDNELEAEMLQHTLAQFGYDATLARDGLEAFELIRTGRYQLVLSDWEMPGLTGVELCRRVRKRFSCGYIYFVLLTARTGTDNIVAGLNAGADDFLTKPFQPQELYCRLRVGERLLAMETRDLTIFSLAKLAESRDPDTGAHLERIREYCRLLADQLSREHHFRALIDGDYIQMIYLTSPLHDVGKVGIPDCVLLKPGKLTDDEFDIMKQHTVLGGQTLDATVRAYPDAPFLQMARDIAWTHHEKYNGQGYPRGLCGTEIPLCGRIVAVADVYDALTTKRVYKEAYSHEMAFSIIRDGRGNHFDPDVVDAFIDIEGKIVAAREQLDLGIIPSLDAGIDTVSFVTS